MNIVQWLVMMVLVLITAIAWAEDPPQDTPDTQTEVGTETDEDGEPLPAAKAIYVPIKPAFVVNYGGQGRLRYLKAEISLRVADAAVENAVRHHLPYIRNEIILLFSKQTEEVLDTLEGKELLRQQALEAINLVLETEAEGNQVTDLYFNQLVIQK